MRDKLPCKTVKKWVRGHYYWHNGKRMHAKGYYIKETVWKEEKEREKSV